jgi:hypothetical protein
MTPLKYFQRNILESMNANQCTLVQFFYGTLKYLLKKYPIVSKISITYGVTIEINSALIHNFIV